MDDGSAPVLPPELERMIFELAAWWHPETIHSLILVARRVCIWVEPCLYRVSICRTGPERDSLLRMVESKQPAYLATHVHHLALSCALGSDQVSRILSICTGVRDLALWTGYTYPELLADLQQLKQLRRLSVNLRELCKTPMGTFAIPSAVELEPFAYLTHLDVFSELPESLWPIFQLLPSLTHLSFSEDLYIQALVIMVLETCTSLQAVIFICDFNVLWEEPPEIPDPRFCVVACPNFHEDWQLGALGKEADFWARADQFIATKRRGEIDESIYAIP
ncbi:hypothetical protein FB45DRAFT_949646 [Roridomyces roridus]|uniref:F-box domain-containing protein n=1 Tax=Roridomyces roridus TaxID=1738132 RepID=A0AAD7F996_9AGAR|nr:hypothetical protein FB45DRAFT_949646 [Roridomyces roridus]